MRNFGVSGDTTGQMLDRLAAVLDSGPTPQVVVILGGHQRHRARHARGRRRCATSRGSPSVCAIAAAGRSSCARRLRVRSTSTARMALRAGLREYARAAGLHVRGPVAGDGRPRRAAAGRARSWPSTSSIPTNRANTSWPSRSRARSGGRCRRPADLAPPAHVTDTGGIYSAREERHLRLDPPGGPPSSASPPPTPPTTSRSLRAARLTFISATPEPARSAQSIGCGAAASPIVEGGALGIVTSEGDFTSGRRPVRQTRAATDATCKLPVGKRSTYVNRANEAHPHVLEGRA